MEVREASAAAAALEQDAAVLEDSAAVAAPADSAEEAVRAEAEAVPAKAEQAGDKRTKENEPPCGAAQTCFANYAQKESLANGTAEFAISELRKKLR